MADGYRPSLVADHLLRAAGTDNDPALVSALYDAVAVTRGYAPEVTADLLDDVAAIGADVPEPLLLDHADALFRRGRGQSAEALIRARIRTVTDPAVAARLQVILIRSLANRADLAAALAVIDRTTAIAGLPAASMHQMEATRAWLLAQAGRLCPSASWTRRWPASSPRATRTPRPVSWPPSPLLSSWPAARSRRLS